MYVSIPFLSDSSVTLKQFRITDGTTIPANGYVVLATHDFAASGLVFDGTNGDSIVALGGQCP